MSYYILKAIQHQSVFLSHWMQCRAHSLYMNTFSYRIRSILLIFISKRCYIRRSYRKLLTRGYSAFPIRNKCLDMPSRKCSRGK